MSEQKLIHSSSLFLRLSSICEEDENRDNRCQYQNSAERDLVDRYTEKTPEDEETKRQSERSQCQLSQAQKLDLFPLHHSHSR